MIGIINGILTGLLIVIFIGIWIWAWSKANKPSFERMSQLPLEDEHALDRVLATDTKHTDTALRISEGGSHE